MNNIENRITNLEEKQNTFETIQKKLLLHTKESDELLMEFVNGISNVVTDEVNKRIDYELETKTQEIKKDLVNVVDEKIKERGLTIGEARKISNNVGARVKREFENNKEHGDDLCLLFRRYLCGVIKNDICKKVYGEETWSDLNPNDLKDVVKSIQNYNFNKNVFVSGKRRIDEDYYSGVWHKATTMEAKRKIIAFERCFPNREKYKES